jgi:hypothetical protein
MILVAAVPSAVLLLAAPGPREAEGEDLAAVGLLVREPSADRLRRIEWAAAMPSRVALMAVR